MSQKLQPVRGTQDLLPELTRRFRFIEETAWRISQLYGYEEIATPIFEFSDVFHRTLGESSDMVSKETYTFLDRGGDSITLRPEGTAGIARAFVSNGLAQNLPLKLYYSGPMFRYERPQKGRYRQFHQVGVECLGLEAPVADVECLAYAHQFLSALGLQDKIKLEINTLGDPESRAKHRELLVDYLQDFTSQLSPESQLRLQKNPLRILDSKNEGDKKIVAAAPSLRSCLNQFSMDFFGKVLEGLQQIGLTYNLNDHLVRGIDYYTHTVFEYTTEHLGSQSAVLAGGRYDGLIEQMGGPKTSGVGWASGVERLALLMSEDLLVKKSKLIAIVPAEDGTESRCLQLSQNLRAHDFQTELLQSGNMGKKMKRADKIGAHYAVIIGSAEMQNNSATIKNLKTGAQELVPMLNLIEYFQKK